MSKTVKQSFEEGSVSTPVQVGEWEVVHHDRIAIRRGFVRLVFLSPPDWGQGVCLELRKGFIALSDGSKVRRLHTWHEPEYISEVEYRVSCPEGELVVYNIFRHKGMDDTIYIGHNTGNAGMVLLDEALHYRRYGCSGFRLNQEFSPTDIEFEIDWQEEK